MISFDTNLLLYSQSPRFDGHTAACDFLSQVVVRTDVVICELVLVDLYLLLRNPAVTSQPLTSLRAADVCQAYRTNPNWRLVENAPVMKEVWSRVREKSFARRRIIDLRLALTLQHHGVTEFATANVKDFQGLGFARVWNPLRG
jgi:toxin-antitoxin system PIN domain toxin